MIMNNWITGNPILITHNNYSGIREKKNLSTDAYIYIYLYIGGTGAVPVKVRRGGDQSHHSQKNWVHIDT